MCDFISKCVRPQAACVTLDMKGYDVPPCFVDVAVLKSEPETGANVPFDRLVMRGWWGKYQTLYDAQKNSEIRKIWVGPMTKDEMLEFDDTYRHNFASEKPRNA